MFSFALAALLPLSGVVAHGSDALGAERYRLLEFDGQLLKWGSPEKGTGATLRYAFVTQRETISGALNCGEMVPVDELLKGSNIAPTVFRAEVASAFAQWAAAADLQFEEAADPAEAEILIGAQKRPRGRAFANVVYDRGADPAPGEVRTLTSAQICLNPAIPWKIGFGGSLNVYDIRYTVMHEIGHVIGLDHPGAVGQVMGYAYTETFERLQPGDIAGAVRLYGGPRAPKVPGGEVAIR